MRIILKLLYRYPAENNPHMVAFEYGQTGYPFIDAGMRQLRREGWIHHIVRNATACFLTRGNIQGVDINKRYQLGFGSSF